MLALLFVAGADHVPDHVAAEAASPTAEASRVPDPLDQSRDRAPSHVRSHRRRATTRMPASLAREVAASRWMASDHDPGAPVVIGPSRGHVPLPDHVHDRLTRMITRPTIRWMVTTRERKNERVCFLWHVKGKCAVLFCEWDISLFLMCPFKIITTLLDRYNCNHLNLKRKREEATSLIV